MLYFTPAARGAGPGARGGGGGGAGGPSCARSCMRAADHFLGAVVRAATSQSLPRRGRACAGPASVRLGAWRFEPRLPAATSAWPTSRRAGRADAVEALRAGHGNTARRRGHRVSEWRLWSLNLRCALATRCSRMPQERRAALAEAETVYSHAGCVGAQSAAGSIRTRSRWRCSSAGLRRGRSATRRC